MLEIIYGLLVFCLPTYASSHWLQRRCRLIGWHLGRAVVGIALSSIAGWFLAFRLTLLFVEKRTVGEAGYTPIILGFLFIWPIVAWSSAALCSLSIARHNKPKIA